jgi:hypothetical protein
MTYSYHHTQLLIEMEPSKFFAKAGLEPWSSWSHPPKLLGLQVWVTKASVLVFLKLPFQKLGIFGASPLRSQWGFCWYVLSLTVTFRITQNIFHFWLLH